MSRAPSIRRRLVVLLLAVLLLAWAIAAWLTYAEVRHELDEMLDTSAVASAHALLRFARVEATVGGLPAHALPIGIDPAQAGDEGLEEEIEFVVRGADGEPLLRSPGGPTLPPPDDVRPGFRDVGHGDRRWRVYTTRDPARGLVVETAIDVAQRAEMVAEVALRATLPLLLVLPAAVLGVWLGARGGLRPLADIANQIARRRPDSLDPLDAPGPPLEIAPLVQAVDSLLARLRSAIERERRFTGDAAHELRTPLSALKTHVQLARRIADPEAREEHLEAIEVACDRATRLVEQLLELARTDAERAPVGAAPAVADLGAVVRLVAVDLANEAMRRRVRLDVSAPERGPTVAGSARLVEAIVRNLARNAVDHAPNGSVVRIVAGADGSTPWLRVDDRGPGIPPEERDRVFERFYRVDPSRPSGSGIGLAIVDTAARRIGANVALLDNPGGPGLRAEVRFTPPEAASS